MSQPVPAATSRREIVQLLPDRLADFDRIFGLRITTSFG
jgi:hypothetical protein